MPKTKIRGAYIQNSVRDFARSLFQNASVFALSSSSVGIHIPRTAAVETAIHFPHRAQWPLCRKNYKRRSGRGRAGNTTVASRNKLLRKTTRCTHSHEAQAIIFLFCNESINLSTRPDNNLKGTIRFIRVLCFLHSSHLLFLSNKELFLLKRRIEKFTFLIERGTREFPYTELAQLAQLCLYRPADGLAGLLLRLTDPGPLPRENAVDDRAANVAGHARRRLAHIRYSLLFCC
jgi:hypothetical protein